MAGAPTHFNPSLIFLKSHLDQVADPMIEALFLMRMHDSPIIPWGRGPIAGYRLKKLKGWEYVDTDPL
jgi:hypothetical protein